MRILTLIALMAAAVDLSAAAKPNVLILYADDLGFGDLGCYNPDSKIPTPNLDRLAAAGLDRDAPMAANAGHACGHSH